MGGLLNGANEMIHGATGLDITGGHAAKEGLEAQQAAAERASALQGQMYNQQRQDFQPYRDAGVSALGEIQTGLGDMNRSFTMADFQADPGYQFRMNEGMKAIERAAGARGAMNSGATLKALQNYGQNMASQEYGAARSRFMEDNANRFNRLSSLANLGQNSTAQVGQAGQNYATTTGNNMMGAANAQAAYGQQQMAQTNSLIGLGAGIYSGSK